jgi:hypothetical protein
METILKFNSSQDLLNFIDIHHPKVHKDCRAGWSKGLAVILDILENLPFNIDLEKFRKEFMSGFSGLFFDVGLVCAGVPEFWLDPQPSYNTGSFVTSDPDEEKKIIRLGLNSTVKQEVSPDSIIERGAVLAVLAYLLEHSGRSVSITQYCAISNYEHSFKGSAVIKPADQPLDLDLLSFWLVSPDSFNNSWIEIIKTLPYSKSFGVNGEKYGYPIIDYGQSESDVFIKGILNEKSVWSRKDSIEWICSELKRLEINYFD